MGDELHAAQNECAHQNLAQLAVGFDQFLQTGTVYLDDLSGLAHPCADHAPPARQYADLSEELSGLVHDNGVFAIARGKHDFHGPRSDHEERDVVVARLYQHLSALNRAPFSTRRDAGDLSRIKGWKDVLEAFELGQPYVYVRIRHGHGSSRSL